MIYTRRDWGKLALAAVPLARAFGAIDSVIHGVQIGVQSYSFRDLSLDDAIAAMQSIGLGECELFTGHTEPKGVDLHEWRVNVKPEYFQAIRKKFDDAGISLLAYNYSFRDDYTDAEIHAGFRAAQALGLDLITASSTLTAAARVAPYAQQYQIRVAMHGHDNTKDPNEFSRPESFFKALDMSPLYRINLDIGHFVAAGYEPVPFIEEHHRYITNLHIKDRKKNHGPNMPLGEGDTPIKAVLLLLKTKKYGIPANIEYEYGKPGMDTVAEVRKCFEYCKQALA